MQTVCAIFVTYNPGQEVIDNVGAIRTQVAQVVIVDNGSSGKSKSLLQELEDRQCCLVVRNQRNLGIAAALNIGIAEALAKGFNWIVTFDQDSRVTETFIDQMLDTYRHSSIPERIAILAPSYVDLKSGRMGQLQRYRDEFLATMTSGSMMPAMALRSLGAFDEELFMDYVDIEFCLRARRRRMTIVQSPAVLFHSLGRTKYYRFCGMMFSATNHSAERRYYITRNRLRVIARYLSDWPYVLYDGKAMIAEAIKIALVEDDKWKKMRSIGLGVKDALIGKMGEQIQL